jgi:glutamyl-tRNA reductase
MEHPLPLEQFYAVGINHHKAPVQIRERFALSPEQQRALLEQLQANGINETFVLSTCNRTEIYCIHTHEQPPIECLFQVVGFPYDQDLWEAHGFSLNGQAAIEHLFQVGVGLDSPVLGDQQIIQQLKAGYQLAKSQGCCDRFSNKLVQFVIEAHKHVRTRTDFGRGMASMASAATYYLQNHVPYLAQRRVLLVGTGKIGTVTCMNLLQMGVSNIQVINRTRARAEELAQNLAVEVLDYDQLESAARAADVIIVATGAHCPVILAQHLPEHSTQYLIDLSVPRNIDPAIDQLPNKHLIDVDKLAVIVNQTMAERNAAIPAVEAIVAQKIAEFLHWHEQLPLTPYFQALYVQLNALRQQELAWLRHKCPPEEWETAERITQRLIDRISAQSIAFLRTNPQPEAAAHWLQQLFDGGTVMQVRQKEYWTR